MTLAFSCEVVHEKLGKSVNICKSYSKKISGTFFSGHGVYRLLLDRLRLCYLNYNKTEMIVTKNLAIPNRSRVSCAHNTSTTSAVTLWPWNLGQWSFKVNANGTFR